MLSDNLNRVANVAGVDTPRTVGEKAQAKALVVVEWQDIISDDGWVVAEDCELPTFYTVGWLEHQDDSVIKIATTLDFDDFTEGAAFSFVSVFSIESLGELQIQRSWIGLN